MSKFDQDLEYNREDILSGIANDFDEEENASEVYDSIYLTRSTPALAETVKRDLDKPTITEQLNK